jgi:hypothetical protein
MGAGLSLIPQMVGTPIGVRTPARNPVENVDVDSEARAIEPASELSAAPGYRGEPIHEWLEVRPFLKHLATIVE